MFSRRNLLLGSSLALLNFTQTTPARATSAIYLTLPQLRARSKRVVIGRPVLHESDWADVGGSRRIVTTTRFVQTHDWLQAESEDEKVEDELLIKTLGGRVGNIGQKVAGEAQLPLNKEILLFIGGGDSSHQRVIGMGQGAYPIEQEEGAPLLRRSHHLPFLVGRRKKKDAPEMERPAVELLDGASFPRAFSLIRRAR